MQIKSLSFLLLITLFFFKAGFANDTNLEVEGAWIAEAPPVSKVMAAYLMIKNTGKDTINIVRAESDTYSSIEFHETLYEDGMARMVRHDSLSIQGTGKLTLKRGGPHLMLFNPVRPLKAGDSVTIKLITDNNSVKTVVIPVKKARF